MDVICSQRTLDVGHHELGLPEKNIMDLIHFQQYVGESLIMPGKFVHKNKCRPSDWGETNSPVHTKTRFPAIRAVVDVRHDGLATYRRKAPRNIRIAAK